MGLRTILITQARYGATRLPGKVLKEIDGKSLLKIHLERLKKCDKISEIVVATTTKKEDDIIFKKSIEWGFLSFRGSELDVLDRFYNTAKDRNADWIVRVTSDCPLIDADLVDKIISFTQENDLDYGANSLIENYPDGQDVEVFKFSVLETAWKNAVLLSDREHVTPFMRNNSDYKGGSMFKALNFPCDSNYSNIRMTVDEAVDFDLIKILIDNLGTDKSWIEYTNFINENNLNKINDSIIRNEGLLKSLKND